MLNVFHDALSKSSFGDGVNDQLCLRWVVSTPRSYETLDDPTREMIGFTVTVEGIPTRLDDSCLGSCQNHHRLDSF